MNSPEFNSHTVDPSITKREIIFVDNPGKQCVQACTAMILKEYLPQVDFSWNEIEKLTGYKEDAVRGELSIYLVLMI